MSDEETTNDEGFEKKLTRLRMRIDSLPPEQRSHLYALADAIADQHRTLQDEMAQNHAS